MKVIDYLCEDLGIIQTIATIIVLFIAAILYLIQISKIQISPYTSLIRAIKRITGIKSLSKNLDDLDEEFAQYKFATYKSNIMIFAQDLKDGENLTNIDWEIIFDNITEVEKLSKKYNFTDALLDNEIEFIKNSHYHQNVS